MPTHIKAKGNLSNNDALSLRICKRAFKKVINVSDSMLQYQIA